MKKTKLLIAKRSVMVSQSGEKVAMEVVPKPVYKTPEHVLARKRSYRQRNAEKIRANRRARYYANLEKERAKQRTAGCQWRERRRLRSRITPYELGLYQVDPFREDRLKQTSFVVCRECGEKKSALHHHLSKLHKLPLRSYLEKWGYPPHIAPSFQERGRLRMKEWVSLHKDKHFGGKRHTPKPEEQAVARRGKAPTPAMRRHAMRLSMQLSGRPRPDRLGKKRLNGVWVQTEPVEDASIAELRLAGRSTKEIAAEVGLTEGGVWYRLKPLGFPSGEACRFLHGEPVAKRHFRDLCNDFGTTMTVVALSLGKNPEYEVARGSATYFGGKTHYVSGTIPPTYYASLSNYLSRHQAEDVLGLRFADLVLDIRKRWTESFCFESHTGKKVRHFLGSELRDLPGLRTRVRDGLNALRVWMRSNPAAQPTNVLNWICMRTREKVAGRDGTEAIASLLFLWPSLRALNENKPGLLAGRRFIDEAVDELLSIEYAAAPSRIARAALGELTALDSRILGRYVSVRDDTKTNQRLAEAERLITQLKVKAEKIPHRPPEDKRAARVHQLRKQGLTWKVVHSRIEQEFHIYTTLDALQMLLTRYLKRQKTA